MKLYKMVEESEIEMLLNEIPRATSPLVQFHHHHHHDGSPLPSYDMHGHDHDMDVAGLMDRLQSIHIDKESIPFVFQNNHGGLASGIPMNPSQCSVLPFEGNICQNPNVGFSPSLIPSDFLGSKVNGFDPYWDSNALNLSILRSPTRSLSPVESFQNIDAFGYKFGGNGLDVVNGRKSWNLDERKNMGGVVNGSLYGSNYDNLIGNKGYIYYLAKDQHGCRFLQRKFDEGKHHVQLIFDGIIGHVVELMKDPFGNYLMQKLFDVCSEEQRTMILLALTEDPSALVRISFDSHGTRAVQKLIETLKTTQQIALVMSALRPGFLDLIKDINGNHVVQHCLSCLKTKDTQFIFDAAAKHCIDIATHRHGCCVLQRCISFSTIEHRTNLVARISSNGLLLAQDAFGNYVVQYILGLKSPSANSSLASQFKGSYVQLSMQKFSSNVVEKCFKEFGEEDKARIVYELLSVSQFEHLLQHPFANYVIQSALLNIKGVLYGALVDAICPHAAVLRTSPYCKRIYVTLSKKCCAF